MRYTITVLLLSAMVVCCPPNHTARAADDSKPRVATFTCDVTPPLGQKLYAKPLATIETPLLAKGIVLDDGGKRYVLCAVDWCGLCDSAHALFRGKIAAAAGTDPALVALHTVHQHTAPYINLDASSLLDKPNDSPKTERLKLLAETSDRLAEAVKKSLDQLQPFDSIGSGRAKVERVASIRRVPIEGGKVRTRWSACRDPELRAMPEGGIDPMVKTITLAQGGKPLVRLHYYATHPQSFYRDGRACYDVPGFARERLEKKENVFQIYFTGCAGDVTMGKYNDGTPKARGELSDRLFAGMAASAAATKLAPIKSICWRSVPVCLLKKVKAKPAASEKKGSETKPLTTEPKSLQLDLSVLRINNVSILHLPGESMIEFQLFAQRVKPKSFVAVAAYGDLSTGYICTEEAFNEGGYEPSASRVVPKSEAVMKAAIRKVLDAE